MKFIFAVVVFLFAVLAIKPMLSAKVCVIHVKNCSANAPVCGRYGRSNLCKRFRNRCDLETSNCSDNVGYTSVNVTSCGGIAVNQRRTCADLSSSTATGGGILSNLFGSNTNNVRPIVINTGK